MEDDIAAVRATAEKPVDDEQDILLVLHSGSGFVGSHAIQGMGPKARGEKGGKCGVVGIVFLMGAVYPEGFEHGALPFAVVGVGCSWLFYMVSVG